MNENNNHEEENEVLTTIELKEFHHLKKCEEILNWIEQDADEISFSNGIHWYKMQWKHDGLLHCLSNTKQALDEEEKN